MRIVGLKKEESLKIRSVCIKFNISLNHKEEKMNIVVNLKESQLQGVLEVLGKSGGDLDITINMEEGEA